MKKRKTSVRVLQLLNNTPKTPHIHISMQDESSANEKHFFLTIFKRCILIGPIVELVFMHHGFAADQYHSRGRFSDLKCPVLQDMIAPTLQLQSFTAGWYFQALSSHTPNCTATHVRQSDVRRSIATSNQRCPLVPLFVQSVPPIEQ